MQPFQDSREALFTGDIVLFGWGVYEELSVGWYDCLYHSVLMCLSIQVCKCECDVFVSWGQPEKPSDDFYIMLWYVNSNTNKISGIDQSCTREILSPCVWLASVGRRGELPPRARTLLPHRPLSERAPSPHTYMHKHARRPSARGHVCSDNTVSTNLLIKFIIRALFRFAKTEWRSSFWFVSCEESLNHIRRLTVYKLTLVQSRLYGDNI